MNLTPYFARMVLLDTPLGFGPLSRDCHISANSNTWYGDPGVYAIARDPGGHAGHGYGHASFFKLTPYSRK